MNDFKPAIDRELHTPVHRGAMFDCKRDKKQRAAGLEVIRYSTSAILGSNVSKKDLIQAIGEIDRGK